MADNKDRRHHHLNDNNTHSCHPKPLTSTNTSSRSRRLLLPSSHSHQSFPPSSVSHSSDSSSPRQEDAVIAAAASSEKKLKVILKLPHTSKRPPTTPSPPLSSPSDPYASSPSHFSDRQHVAATSVSSASEKIPPTSSTASFPASRRSALPPPLTTSAGVPPASLSSLATISAPSAATAVIQATKPPYIHSRPPDRANSATSFAVTSDDEGAEKPSKKRMLRSVADAQNAQLPAPSSCQSAQTRQLHASQGGITSHASSDLPSEKLNYKDKSKEDEAGAEIVSSATLEMATESHPSKRVLQGIIKKLQKKDTFGVFSEPVDPKEVPNYYDIIRNPMDFGTILKKISEGAYISIDIFQEDIFLICTNAMIYNARHTIYYKQARSIHDTAQKLLEALRSGAPIDEEHLRMKQRTIGLSTKKSMNKQSSGSFLFEQTTLDYMSGAMPATCAVPGAWPNETPIAEKWTTQENLGSVSYSETHSKRGTFGDYQADDVAGLSRTAVLKDSRRLLCDENRRNTYKSCNLKVREDRKVLSPLGSEPLQLVLMGYHHEYAYAKSLARFAADLGPVVWRIAAQKIKKVLPPGLPFGPGWVGQQEAPAGANLQSNDKERDQVPQQMQVKVVDNASARHIDQHMDTVKSWIREQEAPACANMYSKSRERDQIPHQMQMKVPDYAYNKHLDQQVCATKSYFREQEVPGGLNLQSNGKERYEMQMKVADHASVKHPDQEAHRILGASGDYSFKCSADLKISNLSRFAVSAFSPSPVCAQKEFSNVNCFMSKAEPAESNMDPSIPRAQLSAVEPIKLSLTAGSLSTDVSQSKLLEIVSQNSRLSPCANGNPNESSVTSQSSLSSAKHAVQERHFETSDNVNCSSAGSNGIASVAGFSKHVLVSQKGRDVISGSGSADIGLLKSNFSGSERLQTSQDLLKMSYLNSTTGPASSKLFSSVDPPICNLDREDRHVQIWVHPRQNDLSNAGCKGSEKLQTKLTGSGMRNQLGFCAPLSSQFQDGPPRHEAGMLQFQHSTRIRLNQGRHESEVRGVSPQHETQRPLTTPFLHHPFLNATPPFVHQMAFLHQQASSKASPTFQSGGLGNGNVHGRSMQSTFPIPMVAGVPPSSAQQPRFVPLQHPLQQGAGVSCSQSPDLNVSLQAPKPPLDQPSNSLTNSQQQQPDLALQL